MPTTNEQVIQALNALLAVCKGSEQAFRTAAPAAKDGHLRTLLKQSSHQHGRLASELRMEIRLLGGEPEMLDGITVPSEVDSVLTASIQQEDEEILGACRRMQEAVVKRFESALDDTNLPLELLIALRGHYMKVRETAAALRGMKTDQPHDMIEAELHPA